MNPVIKNLPEKKLVGKRLPMSLAANRTMELFKSFMPVRNEIKNSTGTDLFALRLYDNNYSFKSIDLNAVFEKWAALEVNDFAQVPEGMESLTLESGLYAVFHYKGLNTDPQIFRYIFGEWLPDSQYEIDQRPHFELLGEKYKNGDPESEEEIWLPIKPK
ncbi:MAG: GyrI-like domain-containing protein [Bacteroidota bacterium]